MGEPLPQIASTIFPVPLRVEDCDGSDTDWIICDDFHCIDPVLGRIDVPKGTITDFGSIPRPFWGIISPVSRYRKPFVIHDRNYNLQKFTQKQADACLLRGMKERDAIHNKISPWYRKKFGLERSTIWFFLRVGGWKAWNDHKKANAEKAKPQG